MAMDTLLVFAASYESVDDAVADYEAVRDIWNETTVGDTYDAAVVTTRRTARSRSSSISRSRPFKAPLLVSASDLPSALSLPCFPRSRSVLVWLPAALVAPVWARWPVTLLPG
jgi:hypothetical protein